jgi:[ribosomal protein S5]-alanine N-acetyltransferase
MELQTERLAIKELSLTDLEDIHQLHSLPETDEFNTLGIPASIQTTESLLAEWIGHQNVIPRTSYTFCIKPIGKNTLIGLIALNLGKPQFKIAEVWYKTHPAFWRQGYTTEALKKIIEFGFFNLGLHRIEAGCAVENMASIKTLEKAGMIREGSKRKVLPIRGKWVDNYFYSILETEVDQSR